MYHIFDYDVFLNYAILISKQKKIKNSIFITYSKIIYNRVISVIYKICHISCYILRCFLP